MPNPQETSKADARTEQVPLESASPTGHDEIASQIAKEALGDGAADRPVQTGTKGRKEPQDTDQENPKRTHNSRPD